MTTENAITFDQWNTTFHAKKNTAARTQACASIRKHTKNLIGNCKLADLKPTDISRVYATMHQNGCTDSTICQLDSNLNRLLKAAVSYNHITVNPLDYMDRPTYTPKDTCPWTDEDMTTIQTAIQNSAYSNLLTVIIETGISMKEAIALTWSNIDLRTGMLTAERKYTNLSRSPQLEDLIIPNIYKLNAQALQALRQEKKSQDKNKEKAGTRWFNTENLVFTNTYGCPIHNQMLTAESNNMKLRTHLKDFSFKKLVSEVRRRKA